MHRDEEVTHARFIELLHEIITPAVSACGGRIVKSTGDGFLAEFSSAVEALRCALGFQGAIRASNTGRPTDGLLEFRVGITLGDVIAEPHDIFGDDVNVTARLQAAAEPGGILVSQAVQERVLGRLPCAMTEVGELTLKNIAHPIRVWRVLTQPATTPVMVAALRPTVAVLPFDNLSGSPEQDYFADGFVEEVITALSRVRWFSVVARNSSFVYKGRAIDINRVGKELGVRYVLEGSVRRAANRMRIVAQLIDADTNMHIWAERYDCMLEDVFDLQDRITESVVTAIEPRIQIAELERTRRKRPDNLTAYDCFLRGMARFWMEGFGNATESLGLFGRAIESDPGFAPPYALASQCYVYRVSQGISPDLVSDRADGARMARAAVELDPNDPTVLALASHALGHLTDDYENAETLMDRALTLNPNSALAWELGGWLRLWLGEPRSAIERFQRGFRLSPLNTRGFIVQSGFATAYIMLGEYGTAIERGRKSIGQGPHWHPGYRMLAAALAGAGRLVEAREMAAQHVARNAAYTLRLVRLIYKESPARERLIDCMRKAGIPE